VDCFRDVNWWKARRQKVFSRLSSAQNLQLGGMYDFAVPQLRLNIFDRSFEKRVDRGPCHGNSPKQNKVPRRGSIAAAILRFSNVASSDNASFMLLHDAPHRH